MIINGDINDDIYLANSDMNRLVHGTWYYFYQTLLLNIDILLVLWNILYLSIYWEHGLFLPDINHCNVVIWYYMSGNPMFTDKLCLTKL